MKVYYNNRISGYSGKCDNLIYYYDKSCDKCLARRRFEFKNHPAHPVFRQNQKAIFALNPSAAYRHNLTHYVYLHDAKKENRDHRLRAWPNAFCRLMYAMQKAYGCNLSDLTRDQIISQNLPCISVKSAIEAGLLEEVRGYQSLNMTMFSE